MPTRIYTYKNFMIDSFTDSSVTGLLSGSRCGCMDGGTLYDRALRMYVLLLLLWTEGD